MMDQSEIKRLILQRRAECGLGLCGGCEPIARWLFKNYNVVTSPSYVAQVIKERDDAMMNPVLSKVVAPYTE